MNRDCRLIFEAYATPGLPAVPPTNTSTPVVPARPMTALATTPEAEEQKAHTVPFIKINSDLRARGIAYDILEAIYKMADNFERATEVVRTIASVHKGERKRQLSLKK
jgi:hypothetical protein